MRKPFLFWGFSGIFLLLIILGIFFPFLSQPKSNHPLIINILTTDDVKKFPSSQEKLKSDLQRLVNFPIPQIIPPDSFEGRNTYIDTVSIVKNSFFLRIAVGEENPEFVEVSVVGDRDLVKKYPFDNTKEIESRIVQINNIKGTMHVGKGYRRLEFLRDGITIVIGTSSFLSEDDLLKLTEELK